MGKQLLRIGVFYDGNYFFHVSNYYNYAHSIRRRISIDGLHHFIREYLATQEQTDPRYCRIIDAHYFRGRLNSYEAEQANRLFAERVFEDILIGEGVVTHYLPLRTIHKKFDIVVLIACDGDYVPLVRKINTLGARVMILGWDFEYTDNRNGQLRTTVTSTDLLREATYPVPMHALIDDRKNWKRLNIETLFVVKENDADTPPNPRAGDREQSHVLTLKEGYGFIAKPPNNLFFHWSDVVGIDFNDLEPEDLVEYVIAYNDKGQEVAMKVEKVSRD